MSAQPTSTEPVRAAGLAVDRGYLGRVLCVLIDIACAIAEAVLHQTKDRPGLAFLDGAAVYTRVARAVRRMMLLAMAIDAPGFEESVKPRGEKRAGREGKDAAVRPERLERLDIRYTLKNKTMDQLIGEICRDLGLPKLNGTYDWESLTPEQIAALVAGAAANLLKQAAAKREAAAARRIHGRALHSPSDMGGRGDATPGREARVYDG